VHHLGGAHNDANVVDVDVSATTKMNKKVCRTTKHVTAVVAETKANYAGNT